MRLQQMVVMATATVAALQGALVRADAPDEIRITDQEAWSCAQVIGVRPFPVVGKFKGQQPQQAYMRLLLGELTTALRTSPGVTDVVEMTPQTTVAPDFVIEGEFLELNTGSRAARFWVGMGAGKSKCTVQVRGLALPARAPAFELRHERISAFGLDSDELAENVVEVGRDIAKALAGARRSCGRAATTADPGSTSLASAPPVAPVTGSAGTATTTPGQGFFAIESVPASAEVYIDGEFVGTTPIAEQSLAAGRHEVQIRKKGMAHWSRWLAVSAGSRARVVAEMEPEQPPLGLQP